MKAVVIYQSKYGFTETYARWIAQDLGADLLTADNMKPAVLRKYSTIIYGGGLYAGGVSGISTLIKNFESIKDKALYLFTVGAADVTDPEALKDIRNALKQKLPPAMWEKLHIYHLRGGMKYSKMSFVHRTMMGMLINMLRKKPANELRNDDKGKIETYRQDVDFTDRRMIAPLVEDINVRTD